MDANNDESRNSQSETLTMSANESTTYRVQGQNAGLPTFTTQTQIANGSAQMQAAGTPVLNQDATKAQGRQDVVSNASVGLAITSVTGAVAQTVSSAAAGDDGRGQVAVETTAGSVAGTVVIAPEYLAQVAGAQAFVPTESHAVSGKCLHNLQTNSLCVFS